MDNVWDPVEVPHKEENAGLVIWMCY